MNQVQIIKRDGAVEIFEINKIFRVLKAAGLPENQAQIVIDRIEKWINDNNITSFKSLELRDKVILELKTVNPSVADLYQWYESTKDNN